MLVHLENEDFNEMIKDDLVIVDFYANWCGPCKMLSPVLEEVASSRGNIKVVKVDVENNLIAIKGAVPGPNKGIVVIKDSVKA